MSEVSQFSVHARVIEAIFSELPRRPRDLREACLGLLPSKILDQLPRAYDIIGDVAIVDVEDELQAFSKIIGNRIMKLAPRLRLVVKKAAKTTGQYRTRSVEIIAGYGTTETTHREFSSRFRLDVNSVYFNPRLAYERMRVAKQVKKGEVVVDMFAGVGPYSILIAKTIPNVQVFSIDLNPVAYKYLTENIFLNQVADRVSCHMGDVRTHTCTTLRGIADRVIMNLPSDSSEFVDAAAFLLKPSGGTIHYYTFASRKQNIEDITRSFQSLLARTGRNVEAFTFLRTMKEVSPSRVQIVLDVNVK